MEKGAKETILEIIEQSELPRQKCFHSKFFLNNIAYCDIMDIVFYYISLQEDLDKISKISHREFSRILERITKEWIKRVEKQWGKVKTSPHYGETRYRPRIWDIASAWASGPGPIGGTMGAARYYEVLHPGFSRHDYLLAFFKHPKVLPGTYGNWPHYKKQVIEAATFPKWRRKMNRKRLETVFDLAEEICQELRKQK